MLRFWRMPCPCTGQDYIIPDIRAHGSSNFSGMNLQQEPKGSHQRYFHSSPWCRAFETLSHCLGSESITHPNPEGRVTAGADQWLMANTYTSVHGDHEIPVWGQTNLWSYGHPTRTSQGTGPHTGSRVHNILHQANSRCSFRLYLYQHDDLFHEPSGLGSYSLGGWPFYACPPRRGHRFWLGPPSTQQWSFSLHQQLYIFPQIYAELFSFSNCLSLFTVLNCYLACPPNIFICLVFKLSILLHTYHS